MWCEHCRDHFDNDHYVDGQHGIGEGYGPTGYQLALNAVVADIIRDGHLAGHLGNLRWWARKLGLAPQVGIEMGDVRGALKEHYLAAIVCDHEKKNDTPICACSRVHLPTMPTVGKAVDVWVDHVMEVIEGG